LTGRRGRVPRDLQMSREQARRNLEQFERLVETVLPERANPEALQVRLERAVELRQVAEQQRDAALEEREVVMEELAKLQRVLDQERRERRTGHTTQTPEEPPPLPSRQRVGGRRRRQFVVHTEPEDHVGTEPEQVEIDENVTEEHVQNEPVSNEDPVDRDMLSVNETDRLAEELEGLEHGEPDVVVTEAVTEVHTDEPEIGTDDENIVADAPTVLPDADQPPTDEIEFPDEGDEDEHH
jgi:hypothetical protein